MKRIFMFAYQPCQGDTGGGHGGEYRLYRANQKYKLLDNIVFVFGDRIIDGMQDCGQLAQTEDNQRKSSAIKAIVKKMIPNVLWGVVKIIKYKKIEKKAYVNLKKVDNQYHFTNEDIYIFHDQQTAHQFVKYFPMKKCVLVYHAQGSLYNEWSASTGHQSNLYRFYLNIIFKYTVNHMKYLGFPAQGAEESLILSDKDLKDVVLNSNRRYLQSGVYCPDIEIEQLSTWIKEIKLEKKLIFVTVATLNTAKAVERIPEYLGEIKKHGYNFKWILVGNGVQADAVNSNIINYEIKEETYWIKDYIAHDKILQIMSIADFYILFHKYSIFDLSTLEAMHYGAIPILTPVGGNKEVIIDENGIFVKNFADITDFEKILNDGIECIKQKNRIIQMNYFDDQAFLKRYVDLCAELSEGE